MHVNNNFAFERNVPSGRYLRNIFLKSCYIFTDSCASSPNKLHPNCLYPRQIRKNTELHEYSTVSLQSDTFLKEEPEAMTMWKNSIFVLKKIISCSQGKS